MKKLPNLLMRSSFINCNNLWIWKYQVSSIHILGCCKAGFISCFLIVYLQINQGWFCLVILGELNSFPFIWWHLSLFHCSNLLRSCQATEITVVLGSAFIIQYFCDCNKYCIVCHFNFKVNVSLVHTSVSDSSPKASCFYLHRGNNRVNMRQRRRPEMFSVVCDRASKVHAVFALMFSVLDSWE